MLPIARPRREPLHQCSITRIQRVCPARCALSALIAFAGRESQVGPLVTRMRAGAADRGGRDDQHARHHLRGGRDGRRRVRRLRLPAAGVPPLLLPRPGAPLHRARQHQRHPPCRRLAAAGVAAGAAGRRGHVYGPDSSVPARVGGPAGGAGDGVRRGGDVRLHAGAGGRGVGGGQRRQPERRPGGDDWS